MLHCTTLWSAGATVCVRFCYWKALRKRYTIREAFDAVSGAPLKKWRICVTSFSVVSIPVSDRFWALRLRLPSSVIFFQKKKKSAHPWPWTGSQVHIATAQRSEEWGWMIRFKPTLTYIEAEGRLQKLCVPRFNFSHIASFNDGIRAIWIEESSLSGVRTSSYSEEHVLHQPLYYIYYIYYPILYIFFYPSCWTSEPSICLLTAAGSCCILS